MAKRATDKKPTVPAKGGFTDAFVRDLGKPTKGQWQLMAKLDRGLSLMLAVSYGGTKSWRCVRYENSKPIVTKLGVWEPGHADHLDVKAAKLAAEAHRAKPEVKVQEKAAGTFGETAERWLASEVRGQKHTAANIEYLVTHYVYPYWQKRAFADISKADVTLLLDKIPAANKATRQRVLNTVRSICNWQAMRMDGYTSPVTEAHRKLHDGLVPRERALSDAEIKTLWLACEREGTELGRFIQFSLLCGQRRQKITDLLWSDIVDGVWRVRRQDGEKETPKALPLPPLALAVLDRQAAGRERTGRVWSATPYHTRRVAEFVAKCPLDERWTLHDLRRTCRTVLGDLGVSYEVAESVLGHAVGTAVARIYDRSADGQRKGVIERIGDALVLFADHVATLTTPPAEVAPAGNVVALKAA